MSSHLRSEFDGLDLGDARRERRALAMVDRMGAAPAESLPKMMPTASELEGAYRFLENESVSAEALLAPHIKATIARASAHSVIRIAHDTTALSFGGDREGLGALGPGGCGFEAHVSLAISGGEERAPLGVVMMDTWANPRADPKQKRWQKNLEQPLEPGGTFRKWSEAPLALQPEFKGTRVVHLMDREADDFALFAALKKNCIRFVIRGKKTRKTVPGEPECVGDVLAGSEVLLKRRVRLGPRPDPVRGFSMRAERDAVLSIRASTMWLKGGGPNQGKRIKMNVVEVIELKPPKGEEPTNWVLFTSEPIENAEQVAAVVDHYRARWRVEEFFKALKTGCSIEKRQLTTFASLNRALALFIPVAWHLLALRTTARERPDEPANNLLTPLQLTVLRALAAQRKFTLGESPSAAHAILAIACLGGHLKRNGDPGWMTLGRGYEELRAGEAVWALARAHDSRSDQS